MNISKLALIALLGSALMAFGCGDDETSTGGSGGSGGGAGGEGGTAGSAGGAGGEGGGGGIGGAPGTIDGEYTFTCTLSGLPIPLPVVIKINADDPGFAEGETADLTTLLNYVVAPAVIDLLPGLAPDAVLADLTAEVGVEGGTPGPIEHTAEGLPFSPVPEFNSDEVTTSVTPDADEVSLSVISFTTTITGLPPALIPGGEIALTAGEGDCGALEPVEGSGPLAFPVAAAN